MMIGSANAELICGRAQVDFGSPGAAGNSSLRMIGEIMSLNANGRPAYEEWLYKKGALILHSFALCEGGSVPEGVVQAAD